jgi:hypothetical protein
MPAMFDLSDADPLYDNRTAMATGDLACFIVCMNPGSDNFLCKSSTPWQLQSDLSSSGCFPKFAALF